MSESSLSLTAVPFAPALLSSLSPLLDRWLPQQRWFAGKGRPIRDFTLVAATELMPCVGPAGAPGSRTTTGPPGLLHLLVRARHTFGAEPEDADCYQLLLGVRTVVPPELAPAVLGRLSDGPLQGSYVYEALHDPRLTALLLERIRTPGQLGTLRFSSAPNAGIPPGLAPVPLAAEQSNSSVVYGDSYILKLFRRVSPGANPDLELPQALGRQACDRVPAPVGWFETAGTGAGANGTHPPRSHPPQPDQPVEPMTLGVLQPYLPGTRDGWRLALDALADGRDFTADAYALGRATAEVHNGLADALPTSVLDCGQLEAVAQGMTARLEAAADAVPALRPYVSGLRATFAELAPGTGSCRVQRVHGDLHLGQTLRGTDGSDGLGGPGGRWSLIDFEGEPARPLAERRLPQPPVRDIAGMLRSFDYAACQGAGGGAVAEEWAVANRHAYCTGYAAAAGADPRDGVALLRAYETDKAIYEVLYEARHRPDWLAIPLSAISRLADSHSLRRF